MAVLLVFGAACATQPPRSPAVHATTDSIAEVERNLATDASKPISGPRITSQTLSFASRPGWRSVPNPAEAGESVELTLERTGSRVYIFASVFLGSGRRLDAAAAGVRERVRSQNPAILFGERRFFLDEESLAVASLMRGEAAGMPTWTLTAVAGDRTIFLIAAGEDLGLHESETIEMLRSVRFADESTQP